MNFKKQLLVLVVIALVVAAFTGCTATDSTDSKGATAANYNQGALSEAELNAKLIKTIGLQSLLDLVDQDMLADIQPITEDMTQAVNVRISTIKSQYLDKFDLTLKMNGFDSEDELKNALLFDAQRQAYINHFVGTTLVTEDDIQAYYDQFEPQIQASHILIRATDDSQAAQDDAKKLAQELTNRIAAGEDFAALAVEFSNDPGSGANGGDLGPFGRGMMVTEFEDAAFTLAIGEVTAEPVKTQFGYHIIKKTAQDQKLSFEEMKLEIQKLLAEEKLKADQNLGTKALIQLRKDNGMEILNPVLSEQYKLFTEQLAP